MQKDYLTDNPPDARALPEIDNAEVR